ncbi:MAG TPA: hypothetical protein QGG59_03390 [Planctomycetota bacterium]|nr:hypothetical protein [Planctomycetota bacterium]
MTGLELRGLRAGNLQSIDLDFPLGEWTALFGPSGAGKSALLFGVLEPVAKKRFRILEDPRALPSGNEPWLDSLADSVEGLQPMVTWVGEIPRNRRKSLLADALNLWPTLAHAVYMEGDRRCSNCGEEWRPQSLRGIQKVAKQFTIDDKVFVCSEAHGEERDQLLHGGWTRYLNPEGVQRIEEAPEQLSPSSWLLLDRFRWKREREKRFELAVTEAWNRLRTMRIQWGGQVEEFAPPHACPNCQLVLPSQEPEQILQIGAEVNSEWDASWVLQGKTCGEWRSASTLDWRGLFESESKASDRRLDYLIRTGLGHLDINRKLGSLSLGEARRLELTSLLSQVRCDQMVLFDEPGMGLHGRERKNLVMLLQELVAQGNTVLTADPSREFIEGADAWVRLGPGGGPRGGEVVAHGKRDELTGIQEVFLLPRDKDFSDPIGFTDLTTRHLEIPKLCIPMNGVVAIAGVSGSGKTTLLEEEVIPRLRAGTGFRGRLPNGGVAVLLERALGSAAVSTVATLSGTWADIRSEFANGEEGRIRGLDPSDFTALKGKGACSSCHGHGVDLDRMPCPECESLGLRTDLLEVRLRSRSLRNWLQAPLVELLERVPREGRFRRCLQLLIQLGMGERSLGERGRNLSLGERSRIALAKELASGRADRPKLFLLDEPCLGLPLEESRQVVEVLRSLTQDGHSFLIVEHNELFLRAADWVLELGPGAGKYGGHLIFEGSAESLLKAKTPTGLWLASRTSGETPSSSPKLPQPLRGGALPESRRREGRQTLEDALAREFATRSPLAADLLEPMQRSEIHFALPPTAWPSEPPRSTPVLGVLGLENTLLKILRQEGERKCADCGGQGPWPSLNAALKQEGGLVGKNLTWSTMPRLGNGEVPPTAILLAAGFRRILRGGENILLQKGVSVERQDELLLDRFVLDDSSDIEHRLQDLEHHACLLGKGVLYALSGSRAFQYKTGSCPDCGRGDPEDAAELDFFLDKQTHAQLMEMDCGDVFSHVTQASKEPSKFEEALRLLHGTSLLDRKASTSWGKLQEFEQRLARFVGWLLFPVEGVVLLHDQPLAGLPVKLAERLANELEGKAGHQWTHAEGIFPTEDFPAFEEGATSEGATSLKPVQFSLGFDGNQWSFPTRCKPSDTIGRALGLELPLLEQFLATEEARQKGWKEADLKLLGSTLSCQECLGKRGRFLHPELFLPCAPCGGTGWSPLAARLDLRGLSWRNLGGATLSELLRHFADSPRLARTLELACEFGLGDYPLQETLQRLPLGDRSLCPLIAYLANGGELADCRIFTVLGGLQPLEASKVLSTMKGYLSTGSTPEWKEHHLALFSEV